MAARAGIAWSVFSLVILTAQPHAAFAGLPVWTEDFDSYIVNGGIIGVGNGGWEAWDDDVSPANRNARILDFAFSPPNSLSIRSGTDVVQLFDFSSGVWSVKAKVYIGSVSSGEVWLILLNRYVHNGEKNWSTQVTFDSDSVSSHGGDNFFSRAGVSVPTVLDTWVDFRVDIDLDNNSQTVFYDGKILHQTVWFVEGISSFQALNFFADREFVGGFFFDDLSVESGGTAAPDCNGNGVLDSTDIATGESEDCNSDGVPDECLASPLSFESAANHSAGSEPASLTIADLDGNGANDLAVTGSGSNDVSVRLGNGDGSFGSPESFPVGLRPDVLDAGYLDDDNHLDLVTANRNGQSVTVLRNDGNGGFSDREDYAVGGEVVSVAIADLVGGSALDVAAVAGERVWIFENTGNGDLTLNTDVFEPWLAPNDVAAARLDGNDTVDLVTAHPSTSVSDANGFRLGQRGVSVILNNGDDTFTVSYLSFGESAISLTLADIDNDGDIDIAGTGAGDPFQDDVSSSTVFVFRNRGDATFDPAEVYTVGSVVEAITAGDLNGDGLVDLAAAGFESHVWVLPNRENTAFGTAVRLSANETPTAIAAAYLNDDDRLDLAVTNFFSDDVSVLLNLTDPAIADCNGNSRPDACEIAAGSSSDSNNNGVPDECEPLFRRGDANNDGLFDVSDPITTLEVLFLGRGEITCEDAADSNDDGMVDVSDPISTLTVIFLGQGVIPLPGSKECGIDPTWQEDPALDCESYTPSCDA